MIPNKDRSSGIKAKVILSFGLAICTFFALGLLAYTSFDQLLQAIHQVAEPADRSKGINAMVMHLSEAESSIRAYSISKNKKYYSRYIEEIGHMNTLADSLLTSDLRYKVGSAKLDSVSVLLHQKIDKLQGFVKKKGKSSLLYSKKVLEHLDSNLPDTTTFATVSTIKSTESTSIDTLLVPRSVEDRDKAHGFLNKIKRLLSKKTAMTTVVDTVTRITHETKYEYDTSKILPPDTLIVDEVKRLLDSIRNEEYHYYRVESLREMELLKANSEIIGQVRALIRDLEDSENNYYLTQKKQARIIVNDHITVIVVVIVLSFLGCLVCILLIFGDISKSNFYKKRLEKARLRAEKLAKTREDFLANISHELRTPLNAIAGFTGQLSGTELSPKQSSYLSIINNSSKHLLSLVNDILDMSKMEAGGFELNERPFDLLQVLEEICQVFEAKCARKGILFTKGIPSDMEGLLFGDSTRLKQVLFNLMDNAVKFTDKGEIRIAVDPGEKHMHLSAVSFSISDSGSGIPSRQLNKIFDSFYQGDSTINKKHLGTGLGLPIAKKIVHAMGGDIEVDSKVGHGTTFHVKIRFPRVDRAEGSKHDDRAEEHYGLDHLSILVIDDDTFNRALLETILLDKVKKVKCCYSAEEGLKAMSSEKYDVILTDIHMPGLDGKALLKKIQAHPAYDQSIPVIAVTADATRSKKWWIDQEGFDDCITKPFEQESLLVIIRQLTAQKNEQPRQDGAVTTLDLQAISVFAAGDPQVMTKLLVAFHDNVTDDLKMLQDHYRHERWYDLKEQAHKMISSFGQLKVHEVVHLLRSIEKNWTQGVHDYSRIMNDLSSRIEETLLLVKDKISELRSELAPSEAE